MTDPISGISATAAVFTPQSAAVPQAQPAVPAAPAAAQPAPPDLQIIAAALSLSFHPTQTDLHFQVDHITGQMVVSVIDAQDGKTLLQIPGEEALAIAQSLQEMQPHLIQREA
jgi:flagellar protein FlaG